MNSVSKISNFARAVVLIFMVKMFFFTAFFTVEGSKNIPQNIFEYSHNQYSSTEKLKRIRETNFEEWLDANIYIKSAKLFPKRISKFICNVKYHQLFSFVNHIEKTSDLRSFYLPQNLSALLNNRSYLRYQKLIL